MMKSVIELSGFCGYGKHGPILQKYFPLIIPLAFVLVGILTFRFKKLLLKERMKEYRDMIGFKNDKLFLKQQLDGICIAGFLCIIVGLFSLIVFSKILFF